MRFFLLLSLTDPNRKDIQIDCNFLEIQKKIYQYVVLLQDNKNTFKGTGYLVTAKTLITPSVNLKYYHESIHFRPKTTSGNGKRCIFSNATYNNFLSVARVSSYISILCYPRITTPRKKFL